MLDYAPQGDTITVTKLCRLARNTKHLLEIVEYLDGKGVSLNLFNLRIDTPSPTGRLILTMIGAVTHVEHELLLERQAEGIAIAKAKGKYKGRKPTNISKIQLINELLISQISKVEIAEKRGLSLSTIYRIKKTSLTPTER